MSQARAGSEAAAVVFASCMQRVPDTPAKVKPLGQERHATTEWIVAPSLDFDTLCFIGVLADAGPAGELYRADAQHFLPLLT